MRVGMLTKVRLLHEAIASALSERHPDIGVAAARTISDLEAQVGEGAGIDLVIVDTIMPIDLEAIRTFHGDHPDVPLLALGIREHEASIISHGAAGFTGYLRREDGLESLCKVVEDALEGRLECSPEIAAAMMRALFERGPMPVPRSSTPLTRRQHQVARLVARAYANKEIARELKVSESTVKHHVHAILGKFGVSTRGQLMRNMREELWEDGGGARRSGAS